MKAKDLYQNPNRDIAKQIIPEKYQKGFDMAAKGVDRVIELKR